MGQEVKQKVNRLPYVMSEEEMTTLLTGILNFGPEETKDRILSRSYLAISMGETDVDSMLMDMHDTLLNKARSFPEDNNYAPSKNALYHLARIMRTASYNVRKMYEEKNDDHRFLKLASDNPNFPEFKLRE